MLLDGVFVLQAVRTDGKALLPYSEQLISVLKVTLHLKCKEAADMAGSLLRHLLRGLTLTYALDHRSTTMDWDRPLMEVLPIREWGTPGDLHNLQLLWHTPSPEEKAFAVEILQEFLVPELKKIHSHTSKEQTMTRWVLAWFMQKWLVHTQLKLPIRTQAPLAAVPWTLLTV